MLQDFSVKVTGWNSVPRSLTSPITEFTGQAQLQLFDATTNQSVDGWFQEYVPNQYFTVGAGQSEVVKFPIQVPYLFNKALTWRVVAKSLPGRESLTVKKMLCLF